MDKEVSLDGTLAEISHDITELYDQIRYLRNIGIDKTAERIARSVAVKEATVLIRNRDKFDYFKTAKEIETYILTGKIPE